MTHETIEYRGYEIEYEPRSYIPTNLSWTFTHKDYDGPEDRRHGRRGDIQQCVEAINSLEDEE